MCLPCLVAEGVKAKDITDTLDQRRFASAASANHCVEITVEMHGGIAQKSAFPCHGEELNMGLRWRITVQSDTGLRVQKRLAKPFNRDGRHLDEA